MRNPWLLMLLACVVVAIYLYFNSRTGPEPETPLPSLSLNEDTQAMRDSVSERPSSTGFQTPEPEADTARTAADTQAVTLDQQARDYLDDITATELEPVPIENADHFITGSQVISLLPDDAVELTTPEKLLERANVEEETVISVVRTTEQIEVTTAGRLLNRAGGSITQTFRLLDEDNNEREISIRELATEYGQNRDAPLTIVRDIEHIEIMTAGELEQEFADRPDTPVRVITKPYKLPSTTISELMTAHGENDQEAIFYVRTITEADDQGIWGVIHHGLVDNFATGIAIRQGQNIDTYQVAIPEHADEREQDKSSSFLGQKIFNKSVNSFVYNYVQGKMGQNPDVIRPGQELLIIRFESGELIDIYKYFVNNNR